VKVARAVLRGPGRSNVLRLPDHHDVLVVDAEGRRLGGGRLPEGAGGIARFHELAARHADDPGQVVIGIETDRGLFVAALVAAGYQVFAVNPMSTSRYRDRHLAPTWRRERFNPH